MYNTWYAFSNMRLDYLFLKHILRDSRGRTQPSVTNL